MIRELKKSNPHLSALKCKREYIVLTVERGEARPKIDTRKSMEQQYQDVNFYKPIPL